MKSPNMGKALTGDSLSVPGALASCHEDNIALACIGILLFKEEELIDAILVQGGHLDNDTNRAGEATFNDKILLATDLEPRRVRIQCCD